MPALPVEIEKIAVFFSGKMKRYNFSDICIFDVCDFLRMYDINLLRDEDTMLFGLRDCSSYFF